MQAWANPFWRQKQARAMVCKSLMTILCAAVLTSAYGQDTWEYSVRVSATVQSSPPQIKLVWPQDTVAVPSSYTVFRKSLSATSWGNGTALSGSTTNYTDTNVANGAAYEYQIVKAASGYTGYGYIYAGINFPLTESRGTVDLIVDNRFSVALSNQLQQLEQDLVGDGWAVLRHDVATNNTVQYVKSLIQADYNADPADVNTVFLFGHIPVPYSGDIAPDEHVPNHQGAWPADVYYGDLFGNWTDSTVRDTNADYSRNWNVPGDGKFDQSSIPGSVELMVGRVDMYNLPGLTSWNGSPTLPSEQSLLANYLAKDHNYRTKVFNLPRTGLIGDYFGNYNGEAFAASGWRNFAPFFGYTNIINLSNQGTWISTLRSQPFLWSYGCGSSGTWNSINDLGDEGQYYTALSPDFYNANVQTVFTMLFGSWFGDWDVQDDVMRETIAAPTYTLACLWSGSPHWFCQHMALGQTLGFSTRLTQNNGPTGLYQTEKMTYAGLVHVALMGDPTLRMHVVAPAMNLTGYSNSTNVQLSWNASPDTVVGYDIYRASSSSWPFTRVNAQLVTGTNYIDGSPSATSGTYMVRAVKLESTPSGTYYNASQGTFSSVAPAPFFNGEAPLGNDWYYLSPDTNNVFGYVDLIDFPYIFQLDMGWEYFFDAGNAQHGAYFYDFTDGVFFYTQPSLFPYIYDFRANAWMYYSPLSGSPGRYTSKPRWFYNFSTNQWVNHL